MPQKGGIGTVGRAKGKRRKRANQAEKLPKGTVSRRTPKRTSTVSRTTTNRSRRRRR